MRVFVVGADDAGGIDTRTVRGREWMPVNNGDFSFGGRLGKGRAVK